jgi:hypothetical protein
VTAQGGIRVDKIKVHELVAYARRFAVPEYRGLCAITPQRAAAHEKNPYAAPDDVGLLVAYDGDELIGYLGILPGLWRRETELRKVYWLTALYVAPVPARALAGTALLLAARRLRYDMLAS